MIDYETQLNAEQRAVVFTESGPILVIAGAGSGKTRTLTYRVARLIESGVPSGSILLATFTNKAARSMLSQVENLVKEDLGGLWGGTFHHIGNRILRMHATELGYERNYSILDEGDARHFLNSCIESLGYSKFEEFPSAQVLKDIISLSVNTGIILHSVVADKYRSFLDCTDDIYKAALHYRVQKRESNLMDFDDLLCNWRELLTTQSEVMDQYARKFRYILVDEYQDTNTIQAEIVDLLASHYRNLMVVGDDSQSIYSFRGADFRNIIRFPEKYPDAQIFKLETNYRSTPEILHLANMSIENNKIQFRKELRAVRKKGARPVVVPLRDVMQQADFVAQHIIELHRTGIPLNEIAVLYRAHYHAMELQMELVRRGVPFEIRSGIRFFEQAHVKDVIAFMRILANPRDEVAWKRALRLYPHVGAVTAQKIWEYISSQDDPLAAARSAEMASRVPKGAQPGMTRFSALLSSLDTEILRENPGELINAILTQGYREHMEKAFSDRLSRVEDLNQLAYFASQRDSLMDVLSELALLTNITEETGPSPHTVAAEERVILSSIHQAKGLEWSVVFMIWCSEGKMPLGRALREPGGEDEERRLFYVATTRAKDRLYFCHTMWDHERGMRTRALAPSRFINELTPSTLQQVDPPFEHWSVNES